MCFQRHTDLTRPRSTLKDMETFPAIPHTPVTALASSSSLHLPQPHEAAASLPDKMAPRHGAPAAKGVDEFAAGGLGGDDVDNGVEEALHGQDEGGDVVEGEVDAGGVDEGVHPVGGGGNLSGSCQSRTARCKAVCSGVGGRGETRTQMMSIERKKRNATRA